MHYEKTRQGKEEEVKDKGEEEGFVLPLGI